MTEHFPTLRHADLGSESDNGASVTAREIAEHGGEDIDEELEDTTDDHQEPTESQKREVLKIHRNLGHPTPQELGRALKHANAKRHIIRWAVKEMRFSVCESRVRPSAKRPGALPRCLKFNEVVGVDLIEFDDVGLRRSCSMLCVRVLDTKWLVPSPTKPASQYVMLGHQYGSNTMVGLT